MLAIRKSQPERSGIFFAGEIFPRDLPAISVDHALFWRNPSMGSNHRHGDFQSDALPTLKARFASALVSIWLGLMELFRTNHDLTVQAPH
jgi:hypothetical protein